MYFRIKPLQYTTINFKSIKIPLFLREAILLYLLSVRLNSLIYSFITLWLIFKAHCIFWFDNLASHLSCIFSSTSRFFLILSMCPNEVTNALRGTKSFHVFHLDMRQIKFSIIIKWQIQLV